MIRKCVLCGRKFLGDGIFCDDCVRSGGGVV